MNSGSASIERHDETQAPHWMHAIAWVTSIIDSGGTMYSRSGASPWGRSQGVTRRILVQWVDSMSVTRSLITGMLPIGSITIGALVAVAVPPPECTPALSACAPIGLLASAAVLPLTAS